MKQNGGRTIRTKIWHLNFRGQNNDDDDDNKIKNKVRDYINLLVKLKFKL